MPKRTSDLTKAQRVLIIRRAIEKYGGATLRQLLEYFEFHHQTDVGAGKKGSKRITLRRKIHEDLNALMEIQEVIPHAPDGESGDTEDRGRIYTLAAQDDFTGIPGAKLLGRHSVQFFTPSGATIPWEISRSLTYEPTAKPIRIFFPTYLDNVMIRIPKPDLPATIVVGRIFDRLNDKFPAGQFESLYGRRASYLGLVSKGLTTKNTEGSVGNAVIRIDRNGDVRVEEIGLTPHLFAASGIPKKLLLEVYALFVGSLPLTYSAHWWKELKTRVSLDRFEKAIDLKPRPVLIDICNFLFLIDDSPRPAQKEIDCAVNKLKQLERPAEPTKRSSSNSK